MKNLAVVTLTNSSSLQIVKRYIYTWEKHLTIENEKCSVSQKLRTLNNSLFLLTSIVN